METAWGSARPQSLEEVARRARQHAADHDHDGLTALLRLAPVHFAYSMPPAETAALFCDLPEASLHDSVPVTLLLSALLGRSTEHTRTDARVAPVFSAHACFRSWRTLIEGMRLRAAGDPLLAFETLSGLPEVTAPTPINVDPSYGMQPFFIGQCALAGALSGRIREALALYDKALLVPPTPGLEVMSRELLLRSALLLALYGDRDLARVQHGRALAVVRGTSWIEEQLDLVEELVSALLLPDESAAQAFESVHQLTYHPMGELWPLFLTALQQTGLMAGRRLDARARLDSLHRTGLGQVAGTDSPGSLMGQLLALDSVYSGNVKRADDELSLSDDRDWRHQAVLALLTLAKSSPRRAIQICRGLSPHTAGLRQAETRRRLILAMALHADGDTNAAGELVGTIDRELNLYELAAARLISVDALGAMPGWSHLAQSGSPGLLDLPRLTTAELRVLAELSLGRTVTQVARALFLSENTVKSHRRSLYRKLRVSGADQAILVGQQRGLV